MAERPPTWAEHRDCGGAVQARLVCEGCGADVDAAAVTATAAPGVVAHKGTAVLGRLAMRASD